MKKKVNWTAFILLTAMVGGMCMQVSAKSQNGMKNGVISKSTSNLLSMEDSVSKLNENNGNELFIPWGEIQQKEGVYDWSVVDKQIERYRKAGKNISLQIASSAFSINDAPEYLFTEKNIRRIAKGQWLNFENGWKDYQQTGGTLTSQPNEVVAGKQSLLLSGKETAVTTTAQQNLNSKDGYSIQLDYKAFSASDLVIQVSYQQNGKPQTDRKAYPVSGSGSITYEFKPTADYNGLKVELGCDTGKVSIDNINIVERKTGYHVGTLTMPNYFDPKFEAEFEKFVKVFAERYKDNKTLTTVCVTGYGRWDEVTLCDDTDLLALEDQWTSFGYTDEAYFKHIQWCIDLFCKYFSNKDLIMGVVGFPGADVFKNQELLDWKIAQYAMEKGVGVKYNGWQSKCSEWGNTQTGIFYLINRYKHNPNVGVIFEEGAQINNNMSEIMGHPFSLFNRVLLDNVDKFWIYQNDLFDPYVNRYFHFANEAAGNVLLTKLFCYFGEFPYRSTYTKEIYQHQNQFVGLFQVNENQGNKTEYSYIKGKYAAKCIDNSLLTVSVDDRQRYNGMYGAALNIEYLDQGTDSFTVFLNSPLGSQEAATVKKQNSGQWKYVSVYCPDAMLAIKNGGADMRNEIEISNNEDGEEYISYMDIDYVPAVDFVQKSVEGNISYENKKSLDQETSFVISDFSSKHVSGIQIPVGTSDFGSVELRADIMGADHKKIFSKSFEMPSEKDVFFIPLANITQQDNITITISAKEGSGYVFTDKTGNPQYQLMQYQIDADNIGDCQNGKLITHLPFTGLSFQGSGMKNTEIYKVLPDGQKQMIYNGGITNQQVFFEPQSAGVYEVKADGKAVDETKALSLQRITTPNPASAQNIGTIDQSFKKSIKKAPFLFTSGVSGTQVKKRVVTGVLDGQSTPVLETESAFSIKGKKDHNLHFTLKNNTNSSAIKLMWKTEEAYQDKNSILIPVVPNDNQFREYTFSFGSAKGYQNADITGFRIEPYLGSQPVGSVSFGEIELTAGNKIVSGNNQAFKLQRGHAGDFYHTSVNWYGWLIGGGIGVLIAGGATTAVWYLKKKRTGKK